MYKINTAMFEGNVILLCSKSLRKEELLSRIGKNMQKNEENAFLFSNYGEMKEL